MPRELRTVSFASAVTKLRNKKCSDREIIDSFAKGRVAAVVRVGARVIAIPPAYWDIDERELRQKFKWPLGAELALNDINHHLAADLRFLAAWKGDFAEEPSNHLTVLRFAFEELISCQPPTASCQTLTSGVLGLAADLTDRYNDSFQILVDKASLFGECRRLDLKMTGRPALPGPDGLYEKVIERIITSKKRLTERQLVIVIENYIENLPDKDRLESKTKKDKFGRSYVEGRAKALAALLLRYEK